VYLEKMRLLQLRLFFVFLLMTQSVWPIVQPTYVPVYNESQAFAYLTSQCNFGPRPPGSNNLSLCREYIVNCMTSSGWNVTRQNFTYLGVACTNIISRWNSSGNASLILGAHYDTRPRADQESNVANRTRPIIGANDGASGVAILMELARALPQSVRRSVEFVFFDAEDSGEINGWDWIVGSTYYVGQLSSDRKASIRAMILLDMVGDTNLRLLRETGSTGSLQDYVWSIADHIGYNSTFLDQNGASILDDHSPFLNAGIPSLDIIQHNPFPRYWHTLKDTPDKCSATSLGIVGSVLEAFVVQYTNETTTFTQGSAFLVYAPVLIVFLVICLVAYIKYRRR
jgi:glutaminyl-peptide cyclotransferase